MTNTNDDEEEREKKWLFNAKFLLMKGDYLTIRESDKIYVYNNGRYVDAETFIKEGASELMGDSVSRNTISEIFEHIKRSSYISFSEIPVQPNLVNIQNGVFDLLRDTLMPHTPEFKFFNQLPVRYNPSAKCEQIDKFFKSVVAEKDVELLYEVCGYCLFSAYPIQKAIICVGDGNNGKSTFLSLLTKFLGRENVSAVSLQDLSNTNNRFSTAHLYGKFANIYADLPNKTITDAGKFKMLTGGDFIHGEEKFKKPFSYYNSAKLIFSANFLPEITDQSYAFWRRWVVVNFPYRFEGANCDPNLLNKMTSDEELSGLLNHAIVALKRVLSINAFSTDSDVDSALAMWKERSDSVWTFKNEHIITAPNGFITKDKLYNLYSDFCRDRGFNVKGKEIFSKELAKHISCLTEKKKIGGERVNCWIGIGIKEKQEVSEQDDLNVPTEDISPVINASDSDVKNFIDDYFEKEREKQTSLNDLCVLVREKFPEHLFDIKAHIEAMKLRGLVSELRDGIYMYCK